MEEEEFHLSEAEARQRLVHDEWRAFDRAVTKADRCDRVERWLVPTLGAVIGASASVATVSGWPTSLPFVVGLTWATYMLGGIVAERRERNMKLKQAEKNYDLLCMEVQFLNSPDE